MYSYTYKNTYVRMKIRKNLYDIFTRFLIIKLKLTGSVILYAIDVHCFLRGLLFWVYVFWYRCFQAKWLCNVAWNEESTIRCLASQGSAMSYRGRKHFASLTRLDALLQKDQACLLLEGTISFIAKQRQNPPPPSYKYYYAAALLTTRGDRPSSSNNLHHRNGIW